VAFTPDGRTLASGSSDKTVKLWDVTSGRLRHSLDGHQDEVRSVAFAPDGCTLVSGSADNTIKLWDIATRELLLTLLAMPGGGAIAILPDGRFDGDPTALPQVRIGHGLALYPWEAFPELRSPEAVRAALARFRG
jgi:WD40 repeat protein